MTNSNENPSTPSVVLFEKNLFEWLYEKIKNNRNRFGIRLYVLLNRCGCGEWSELSRWADVSSETRITVLINEVVSAIRKYLPQNGSELGVRIVLEKIGGSPTAVQDDCVFLTLITSDSSCKKELASCDRCHKPIDGIEIAVDEEGRMSAVILHNECLLEILKGVTSIPAQELVHSILEL